MEVVDALKKSDTEDSRTNLVQNCESQRYMLLMDCLIAAYILLV